jgi:hypothetical protein
MAQLVQLSTAVHPYGHISFYVKCILVSSLYVFKEAYPSHMILKQVVHKLRDASPSGDQILNRGV